MTKNFRKQPNIEVTLLFGFRMTAKICLWLNLQWCL